MLENYSILDILHTFSYVLQYDNSDYAVFELSNHRIYVFNFNDKLQFIDNRLQEGEKVALFTILSSSFPSSVSFQKHNYNIALTRSISPDEIKTRLLSLKQSQTLPSNKFLQEVMFESPDGEEKILLFKKNDIVNTLTFNHDRSYSTLNNLGSHSKLFKGDFEGIRIYTGTTFVEDYLLNDQWEDPFLFILNPNDIKVYPGLETYLSSFSMPSIIPSQEFTNDIALFTNLSHLYDFNYTLSYGNGAIIIQGDRTELKKFTNKVQRRFLKLKNEINKNTPGILDLRGVEFYYYANTAYFPLPKNTFLQKYIFGLIQEGLKIPLQIVNIHSKLLESKILSSLEAKKERNVE